MKQNEFLFYPLDTEEDPVCLECAKIMVVAGVEARLDEPNFICFRCEHCGRTEKYICEE